MRLEVGVVLTEEEWQGYNTKQVHFTVRINSEEEKHYLHMMARTPFESDFDRIFEKAKLLFIKEYKKANDPPPHKTR